jgi:hypothetical protein
MNWDTHFVKSMSYPFPCCIPFHSYFAIAPLYQNQLAVSDLLSRRLGLIKIRSLCKIWIIEENTCFLKIQRFYFRILKIALDRRLCMYLFISFRYLCNWILVYAVLFGSYVWSNCLEQASEGWMLPIPLRLIHILSDRGCVLLTKICYMELKPPSKLRMKGTWYKNIY